MVFSGTPRYPQSHGSTLVETPRGDLLAAWYAGSREKGNDVVILASRLRPGGAVWSEPTIAANTPGKPEGNPVLFKLDKGRIALFYQTMHGSGEGQTTRSTGWTTCDIKVKLSTDDGHHWGPNMWVRREWGRVIRCKPLRVGDRIILPAHNEVEWSSLVMIGDDSLVHWTGTHAVDTGEGFKKGNIEPAIVELSSGVLLMYMRSGSRTCIWSSQSNDLGDSWTAPRRTPLPSPDSAIELLRTREGRILLAFNNSSHFRAPLTLAASDDDCRTWHSHFDLERGPGSYSYPAMIQGSDGRYHITYTYRREGIKHVAVDEGFFR